MEFISVRNFDENNWQMYFELSQEILHKYYPHVYKSGRSLEDFRNRTEKHISSDTQYDLFMVINNEIAVAWFYSSIWNNEVDFGFDVLDSSVCTGLLKEILVKLSERMKASENRYSLIFTYREAIFTSLMKINASIYEELIVSQLKRSDMNRKYYDNILINNNLSNWKTLRLSQVPDNYLESFVKCVNVCFEDMRALSPAKTMYPPLTSEEWKKDKSFQRSIGITLDILILLDENDEVAGILWMCNDAVRKETLRHDGGLTAVLPKYRGLGIAKYLKAKMYYVLLDENKDFKFITTDTMPWNKYMFRINEEFGFKPHRKGYAFKLTDEFIANFIKSN